VFSIFIPIAGNKFLSDAAHFSQQILEGSFTESILAKEPDEFQERISSFSPGVIVNKAASGDFFAASRAVRTSKIALFNVKVSNLRVQWDPHADYVSTSIPLDGRATFVEEGVIHHLAPGKAHVVQPETPFDFRSSEAHLVTVLNISRKLVRQTMRDLGEEDETDYRHIPTILDLKQESGVAFFHLVNFFRSELFRTRALLTSPKMTRHMENLLATAFVLATDGSDPVERRQNNWLKPKFVDAALDFMHANLDCPLTLAQISAATGVNARTLTRAFHRAHEIGPVGYHRRLRLERVNVVLTAASAEETTVTDIAMKYGFFQLSHFAAAYRRFFGESPSDTLRY
jgi:AraC-like DNA-binding protein